MKKILAGIVFALCSCSSDNTDDDYKLEYTGEPVYRTLITGKAQKGPFLRGTKIRAIELDSNTIGSTGHDFESFTIDNDGTFEFHECAFEHSYVKLIADGDYKHETTNSNDPYSIVNGELQAVVDLSVDSTVNINVLTHLESERVIKLMSTQNMTMYDAKRQAQSEILEGLGIDIVTTNNSENITLFDNTEESAALLAASILMISVQHEGNNAAKASAAINQGLSDFKTDFADDGILNGEYTEYHYPNIAQIAFETTYDEFEKYSGMYCQYNNPSMIQHPVTGEYVSNCWRIENDDLCLSTDSRIRQAVGGYSTNYCSNDNVGNIINMRRDYITNNLNSWGINDIPDYEKYLVSFWQDKFELGECNSLNENEEKQGNILSGNRIFTCKENKWRLISRNFLIKPECNSLNEFESFQNEMCINGQWEVMDTVDKYCAQNSCQRIDNKWVINHDNTNVMVMHKYSYPYDNVILAQNTIIWEDAMNICPVGWHLTSSLQEIELLYDINLPNNINFLVGNLVWSSEDQYKTYVFQNGFGMHINISNAGSKGTAFCFEDTI